MSIRQIHRKIVCDLLLARTYMCSQCSPHFWVSPSNNFQKVMIWKATKSQIPSPVSFRRTWDRWPNGKFVVRISRCKLLVYFYFSVILSMLVSPAQLTCKKGQGMPSLLCLKGCWEDPMRYYIKSGWPGASQCPERRSAASICLSQQQWQLLGGGAPTHLLWCPFHSSVHSTQTQTIWTK